MPKKIKDTALANILFEDLSDFDPKKVRIAKTFNAHLFEVDPISGNSEIHFKISDDYIHGGHLVQGGIISAMLDFAIAIGALAQVPPNMSIGTATLNVQFFRSSVPGEFISKAMIENHGKRIIFSGATLYDAAGRKIAGAKATNLIVPIKKNG